MKSKKSHDPMVDGRKIGRPPKPPGHVPPSKRRPKERCGALARTTGRPCQRWAMANGRCMMHGGKSLWGKEHPSFKTGLRSRYRAQTALRFLEEDLEAAKALADIDMQGIDDEIRIAMVMLMLYLKNPPPDIPGEWCVRGAKLISALVTLKWRRHKMVKKRAKITLKELEHIVYRLTTLTLQGVEKLVKDEKTKAKLLSYFETIPEQVVGSLRSP